MRQDDGTRGGGRQPNAHVEELLDAYRTGELDASRRAEVGAHIEECARCREELASLRSWAAMIERGYEGRRAAATGLEPDWAAQRAAIVARTSRRDGAAEEKSFWRWVPQVALVAVAALIVGVVWRENAREPTGSGPPAQSERAAAPSEQKPDAVEFQAPADENVDADAQGEEVLKSEDALGRAEPRGRRADEPVSALADRAAEPSLAARLGADVGRFERDARAALEARDTTAARRALALWSDTLAPRGNLAGEPAALADSLRELLGALE
jgi:anti-sigma factor RsiW